MITITANDQAQMVKVQGHAGYAEAGKDIVCAGVSALAWTLSGSLLKLGALTHVDESDGEMLICYRAVPGVQSYLDMFMTGVEMLMYKYPDNVCVQGRKTETENDNMNTKGGGV